MEAVERRVLGMKHLLLVAIFLLSFQVHAEIFVCKDDKNKITYQEKPCLNTTLRTLKNIPDAPIEDQILARDRISKANEIYHQQALKAEVERQQSEVRDRELEALAIERRKVELLEKQAADQAAASRWNGGVRWGYWPWPYKPYKYGTHNTRPNRSTGVNSKSNDSAVNKQP